MRTLLSSMKSAMAADNIYAVQEIAKEMQEVAKLMRTQGTGDSLPPPHPLPRAAAKRDC